MAKRQIHADLLTSHMTLSNHFTLLRMGLVSGQLFHFSPCPWVDLCYSHSPKAQWKQSHSAFCKCFQLQGAPKNNQQIALGQVGKQACLCPPSLGMALRKFSGVIFKLFTNTFRQKFKTQSKAKNEGYILLFCSAPASATPSHFWATTCSCHLPCHEANTVFCLDGW